MKFLVIDNHGNKHITKDYEWDEEYGIPNAETILEQMEDIYPCNCGAGTETQSYCECESNFDNGTVEKYLEREEK